MNETEPTCRATLNMAPRITTTYDCVLPENHAGPHRDEDDDTWDITYRDAPGVSQHAVPFVMNVRPVQDQVTDLATRVGLLEAAWTVGGETLSERLDRVILGMQEQHGTLNRRVQSLERMFVALRTDNTRLHARVTGLETHSHTTVSPEDPERCDWICPVARRRCVLTLDHPGNHLT